MKGKNNLNRFKALAGTIIIAASLSGCSKKNNDNNKDINNIGVHTTINYTEKFNNAISNMDMSKTLQDEFLYSDYMIGELSYLDMSNKLYEQIYILEHCKNLDFSSLDSYEGYTNYDVQSGDNLTKIANKFNVTVEEIKKSNPKIKNDNYLQVGQNLIIDETNKLYSLDETREWFTGVSLFNNDTELRNMCLSKLNKANYLAKNFVDNYAVYFFNDFTNKFIRTCIVSEFHELGYDVNIQTLSKINFTKDKDGKFYAEIANKKYQLQGDLLELYKCWYSLNSGDHSLDIYINMYGLIDSLIGKNVYVSDNVLRRSIG